MPRELLNLTTYHDLTELNLPTATTQGASETCWMWSNMEDCWSPESGWKQKLKNNMKNIPVDETNEHAHTTEQLMGTNA